MSHKSSTFVPDFQDAYEKDSFNSNDSMFSVLRDTGGPYD